MASLSAFQLKENKEGTVKAAVAKNKIEITTVEVILGLSYVFSIFSALIYLYLCVQLYHIIFSEKINSQLLQSIVNL